MTTQVIEQSDVAKGSVVPSEEVVKTDDSKQEEVVQPKHTFKDDEELESFISKKVQAKADSIADMSVQTYQKTQRELEGKIAKLNSDAENRKNEDELRKREASERDEWTEQGIPDRVIGEFQADRRAFNNWTRDAKNAFDNFEKDKKGFTDRIAESDATMLAIQYGLETGKEIVAKLKDVITAIAKGQTPAERELIAIKQSLVPKPKDEKPKHKPDTHIPNAPGGLDTSKMSAEQKVIAGLEKAQRERK